VLVGCRHGGARRALMDSEFFKLGLSVLSAIVAVSSAFLAYRTRRQTRQDVFETQRDILLLTASENDARLKAAEFKLDLLSSRLRQVLGPQENVASAEVARALQGLSEVNRVLSSLRRRDWTEDRIRAMPFSESALIDLRRLTLDEQMTAKTVQVDAHAILIAEAERLFTRSVNQAGGA
jgi:hypothetical protein